MGSLTRPHLCQAKSVSEARRQFDAEVLRKQPQILAVADPGRIAQVMAELELRRKATNPAPGDKPDAGKPIRGISAEGAFPKRLPGVASPVKDDGVEVDATLVGSAQDQARWQTGLSVRVMDVAEDSESSMSCLAVGLRNNEVEVLVWTRLLANERVNAPAAIDPTVDVVLCEALEHFEHGLPVHHAAQRRMMLAARTI
jgi:hypothetical protein